MSNLELLNKFFNKYKDTYIIQDWLFIEIDFLYNKDDIKVLYKYDKDGNKVYKRNRFGEQVHKTNMTLDEFFNVLNERLKKKSQSDYTSFEVYITIYMAIRKSRDQNYDNYITMYDTFIYQLCSELNKDKFITKFLNSYLQNFPFYN